MTFEDVKDRIREYEEDIRRWRKTEKDINDPWDRGYNDGVEDVITSLKRMMEL